MEALKKSNRKSSDEKLAEESTDEERKNKM